MSSSRQLLPVAAIVAAVVMAMPLMGSTASRATIIMVDAGNCSGPSDASELDPYCSIHHSRHVSKEVPHEPVLFSHPALAAIIVVDERQDSQQEAKTYALEE